MQATECYAWGKMFASPWPDLVRQMNSKAAEAGCTQEPGDGCLVWKREQTPQVKYVFVDDPSDIEAIRNVFDDESNVRVPVCFIVVRQPDESDTRGDIIFDIFRLSPKSYLWHFYRVYTPPTQGSSAGAEEGMHRN